VPKAWPSGTPVWFLGANLNYADDHVRGAGEEVEYKLLTRTYTGILPLDDAVAAAATLTERPHLPLRPANVTVHGVDFSETAINAIGVTPIVVNWANRNRLTESSVILPWTAATVTPETDQTTRVVVMDGARNVVTVNDGLVGTTYDLAAGDFAGNSVGIVRVESERDGLISLQGHELTVLVESGYGYGYGYNYGGA